MKSKAARRFGLVVGGLAVLVGATWIGQGAGLIKGSFMTGSRTWLAIGLLCLVVGLLLIFLALRKNSGGNAITDRSPRATSAAA
jgi:cytochrome bd-type quinol oxidase subunit 2